MNPANAMKRTVPTIIAVACLSLGCPKPETPTTSDGEVPEGRWRKADERRLAAEIEELNSLGYVDGSKEATTRAGITVHEKDRVAAGLNLYCSGHAPVAILMDMDGKKLHEWKCTFEQAAPNVPPDRFEKAHFKRYFRRLHLFANGDLLAIFEGHVLVKLDRDSNILWTYEGKPHHDLEVTADGRILLLTRKAHLVKRVNPAHAVLEDFIVVLDADGNELSKFSVLEAFENSGFRTALASMPRQGDLLHTNTLELLDGSLADRVPAFAKGNLLISCLKTSVIAVIDPQRKQVVWSASGGWRRQHQPTILDSGKLLLLDNLGDESGHGRSRMMEIDPADRSTSWVYTGTAEAPFETATCGSGQRFENGNTLVTESDYGRAFEIDRDGNIVWEFISPHRAGPRSELVATLFEVLRLPASFPTDWIED